MLTGVTLNVGVAWLTVKFNASWLARNVPTGVKTARIVWEPAVKIAVVNVDVAELPLAFKGVPAPRSVVPSKNSTAPVGAAPEVATSATVAVIVTAWPYVGFELGPVKVVFVALETCCVAWPELGARAPV